MSLAVGQIWREVGQERLIRIESMRGLYPRVRTVTKINDAWRPAYRSRYTSPELGRFNGKSGGYTFVEVDARFALHFGG